MDDKFFDDFLGAVSRRSGLSVQLLKNRIKTRDAVQWRGAIMLALVEELRMTETNIGSFFGRSQQSVHATIKTFRQDLSGNLQLQWVFEKVRKLVHTHTSPPVQPPNKRPCLKCRKEFEPPHKGIFVCRKCKTTADWQSGYDEYYQVQL